VGHRAPTEIRNPTPRSSSPTTLLYKDIMRQNRRNVVTCRKTVALRWERRADTQARQPLRTCPLPQFGHWPENEFSVVSTFLQNHLGSGEGAAGKGCAAEVIATVSCNYVPLSPRHALCIASRHGTSCRRDLPRLPQLFRSCDRATLYRSSHLMRLGYFTPLFHLHRLYSIELNVNITNSCITETIRITSSTV
jgi:hypothetical protein